MFDQRVHLCDRELLFNYYVASPVRYACDRIVEMFDAGPIIPTHKAIYMNVLDRPTGGVVFPRGKTLIRGPVWELVEKGPYFFLRITSPYKGGVGMEAILAPDKNKVKVFVDTPWAGQKSFITAWSLLFQIIFRASLDPAREQFVRGLGLLVKDAGFLVNIAAKSNANRLLEHLSDRFPCLGENRLLLRREEDGLRLYATPWTHNDKGNLCANTGLRQGVLFDSAYSPLESSLSRDRVRKYFGPVSADSGLVRVGGGNRTPLDDLVAVSLPVGNPDFMAGELEQLATS